MLDEKKGSNVCIYFGDELTGCLKVIASSRSSTQIWLCHETMLRFIYGSASDQITFDIWPSLALIAVIVCIHVFQPIENCIVACELNVKYRCKFFIEHQSTTYLYWHGSHNLRLSWVKKNHVHPQGKREIRINAGHFGKPFDQYRLTKLYYPYFVMETFQWRGYSSISIHAHSLIELSTIFYFS